MYLEIEKINKSFQQNGSSKVKVLDDINLRVEKGQFISIVGPSGCGKSTLLYLIAGLEKADNGNIYVSGKKISEPGPDRVVVFQEAGLFPWLTVKENVIYGLMLKKIPKKQASEKVMEVLKLVHLSQFAHAYPHELSGGMKQRVAIARALVMEPDILLMDEPFAALDEQTRMVLHRELIGIWRETKVTIIFVTHNIREAVLLSEKVYVFGTRPGKVKTTIPIPTIGDGVTPQQMTLQLEQKIFAVLQEEIDKVLKEEMGDAYGCQTNPVYRYDRGDLGSYI